MNTESVPAELRRLPQWVCWREEMRDGKPTKVPYDPRSGRRASTDNPATWTSFDLANQVHTTGRYSGVGYVFTAAGHYTGIDLDKCRNPETGEIVPWAMAIIRRLNSYTEISPSGGGVHVFVRATLQHGPRRRGQIEMYDKGRYFTVTGQHLVGTPSTIEDRQDVLAALHAEVLGAKEGPAAPTAPRRLVSLRHDDASVLQKARSARNSEKFKRLWAGDVDGYPSHSETDLALCNVLAYWCDGDPEQVDRLFRQSGLYRDKWDQPPNGRTYGERTVAEAVASVRRTSTRRTGATGPNAPSATGAANERKAA